MHLSQWKKRFSEAERENSTALVFKNLLLTVQDNSDMLKINTAFGLFVNKKDTNLRIQINFTYIYKPRSQTSCEDFNEVCSKRPEEMPFA